MCHTHGLRVMNTWYKKPQGRKVTYMAPGTKVLPGPNEDWDPSVFAQLDLCLAPDRWKCMVNNVESNPKAGLNSDHFPLEVTLQLKLSKVTPTKQQSRGHMTSGTSVTRPGKASKKGATNSRES